MFGISGVELLIILIFAFIIFGPDKLPQVAKTVGRAIAKFREVQTEAKEAIDVDKILSSENGDAINETIDNVMKIKDKALSNAKEVASDAQEVVDSAKESLAEKRAQYDEERAKRQQEEKSEAKEKDDKEEDKEDKGSED